MDVRFDAPTVGFFLRELEFIESEVLRDDYPEYLAASGTIVPQEIKNMPHIQTTTYRQMSRVGKFKLARDYTTVVPMVDILSTEHSLPVHAKVAGFYYSDDEIEAAVATNMALEQEKVAAVREAAEQDLDDWILWGLPKLGHHGFLNHPDVLYSLAPFPLNSTTTAENILGLLNDSINASGEITKGVEAPNTVLLPRRQFQYINTRIIPDTSGKTILEFLRNKYPDIEFFIVDKLKEASANKTDLMVVYNRNPRKLKSLIMMPLKFFAPERKGFGFQIPAKYKYGGLRVYRPLSVHIVEGI